MNKAMIIVMAIGAALLTVGAQAQPAFTLQALAGPARAPISANATMTDVLNHSGTDSTVTYPVRVEQTAPDQLTIINFGSYGQTVTVTLGSDRTISIEPQLVGITRDYGDFMCYSADWNTQQLGTVIAGTGTDSTLSWGNWGVVDQQTHSLLARRAMRSTITFNGKFTYPSGELTQNWTGSGTQSDPYVITTAHQFQALAQSVKDGNSYKGKYIVLGADLDLSRLERAFVPVGYSAEAPFSGHFDGQGHRVTGLNVTVGEHRYMGLIGYADASSTITRLTADGITIKSHGASLGGVVGYSAGAVSDVHFTGGVLVGHNLNTGGIAGEYQGPAMSQVSFSGSLTGMGETGGIVGLLRGALDQAQSHGTVTMSSNFNTALRGLGGLVGTTLQRQDATVAVRRSVNDATVTDQAGMGNAGGLVGYASAATLSQCLNAGLLRSQVAMVSQISTSPVNGSLGGLVGQLNNTDVTDCMNANQVRNTSRSQRVGGLVGYVVSATITHTTSGDTLAVGNESHVRRCLNAGQVINDYVNPTMGLYGTTYADTVFTGCLFDQQLTGTEAPAWAAASTATLTAGLAPQGFGTAAWSWSVGRYPAPAVLSGTQAAALAALPMNLNPAESVRKVKTNFTAPAMNGYSWRLQDASGNLVTATAGLEIKGDSVTLNSVSSSETLVAASESSSLRKVVEIETVNPEGFVGLGTATNPYLIQDVDDLRQLNSDVTDRGQSHKGDYFLQTADIDLALAPDFKGIGPDGTTTQIFAGTYDGGGHAIHHFVVDSVDYSPSGEPQRLTSRTVAGFFGFVSQDGTVKNLTIASDCSIKAFTYVGAIAGRNDGRIENCRNHGSMTAIDTYVAGIAGYQNGGVTTGCYNDGTIAAGTGTAAGIVAYNRGQVLDCQNDGIVTTDSALMQRTPALQSNVGGIVAINVGETVVSGCVNSGHITGGYNVGGILGQMAVAGTTLSGNLNYGLVDALDSTSLNRGAVLGNASYLDNHATANYCDGQLGWYGACASAPAPGMTALLTRQLTAGDTLAGVDNEKLDFTPGLYPVLKAFAAEPAAQASRRMVLTLADSDIADDITAQATVHTDSAVTWTLSRNAGFALSNGTLTLDLTGVATSLRDTLTATSGTCSKSIALRALRIPFDGAGTAASPFQIKTKDDMLTLARLTNQEGFAFTGRHFKVMNDIDFGDTAYEPVATGSNKFNADFDGGGHEMRNINYNSTSSNATFVGLIGNVGPQGALHDLTLQSGTIAPYAYAGAFAGRMWGKAYNLVNRATVTTTRGYGAAGIVASVQAGGSLRHCVNYGSAVARSVGSAGIAFMAYGGSLVDSCDNHANLSSSRAVVAGIVGQSQGTVSHCHNYGVLNGQSNVAGIVASAEGGDSTLYCVNHAALGSTRASTVAGIVSTNTNGSDNLPSVIAHCQNLGQLSGTSYVGGIAGNMSAGVTIDSCANHGVISATNDYTGGIVGSMSGKVALPGYINKCVNTATVTTRRNDCGGIGGDVDEFVTVTDCRNLGDVTGDRFVGGLVGYLRTAVWRSYNVGNVQATATIAGGLAALNYGELHECFNGGNVTTTGATPGETLASAGGVCAYSNGTFHNTFNLGDLNVREYAAGITGSTYHGTVLQNCYNAGRITAIDSSHVANLAIVGSTGEPDNCYYDTDVNAGLPAFSLDAMASGVPTRELVTARLSDSFVAARTGMYPMLTCFEGDTLAQFMAAAVVLNAGDSYRHVNRQFTVGTPDGTTWTWTPANALQLSGNTMLAQALGAVTLTKTCGNYSRSYLLNIDSTNGINDVEADAGATVVAVEYFDLQGRSLGNQRPQGRGLSIERVTLSNGTVKARKVTGLE